MDLAELIELLKSRGWELVRTREFDFVAIHPRSHMRYPPLLARDMWDIETCCLDVSLHSGTGELSTIRLRQDRSSGGGTRGRVIRLSMVKEEVLKIPPALTLTLRSDACNVGFTSRGQHH